MLTEYEGHEDPNECVGEEDPVRNSVGWAPACFEEVAAGDITYDFIEFGFLFEC